jgi:glycosyltransferase involved in cell wall biosynthesis
VDILNKSEEYLIRDSPHNVFGSNAIDMDNPPRVSFCIPTLNNEDTIDRCLASIIDQDYPDIEIIIIDGYSKDKTIDIAKKYTSHFYRDVGTYGSGCQTGVEHSTGEIIALFDSDIVLPHRRWLRNAVMCFNYGKRISTVWPLCIAPPDGSLFQRLYQTNMHRVLIENRISKNRGLFGGGNSLILKRCIEEIGGIDRSIHWGADFDWARKLKDLGYRVVFTSDPLYHDTMRSIGIFAKKQFLGARTFTKMGFEFTGITKNDILYEHFILGTKEMIKGLALDRDPAWILFPIFISIRSCAYLYIYLENIRN